MANLLSNAECGPSNALSNLSKHSQQDKTLQQDRWVKGNAWPGESFRSPGLNRGPEQAAFQRDAEQFFQQAQPPQLSHPELAFQRLQLHPQQRLPPSHDFEDVWHRQFQRVNISSTPSLPSSQQLFSTRQEQLGKRPELASWNDEFGHFDPQQHFSYQPQVQHRLANMAYAAGPPPLEQYFSQQTSQQHDPKLEDEAFELAFAEAESAVHPPAAVVEPRQEVEEERPKLSEKEEADQLAKTAGDLFDRLQHERETDDKFRNSSFMALMKKLRDKEVIVSGNDMVETSTMDHSHNYGIEGVEESVSM